MAGFAEDFRELEVYREAREVAKRVFAITKKFPREETFAVTDAELRETQHWMETVLDCEYVNHDEGKAIIDQLDRIGRMLITMICKANRFRIT